MLYKIIKNYGIISGEKQRTTKDAEERRHALSTVPVPEAGKWKPRPVLLLHVVLLVFQVRVVAGQQQGHAHAKLAQRVGAAPQSLLFKYCRYLNTYIVGPVYSFYRAMLRIRIRVPVLFDP